MGLIKAIYTIGDSFSFGQELGGSDVEPKDFYKLTDYMRDNSYTGVIGKTWGVDTIINKSLPGGSNDRTVRMLTTDLPLYFDTYHSSEIFVFISLTHPGRREFYEQSSDRWCALIPNYEPLDFLEDRIYRRFWKLYAGYFDSNIESLSRFVGQVVLMQSYLKSRGINYLMTDSMAYGPEFWETYRSMNAAITNQIDMVHYNTEEPFNWFCGRNKLPIGKHLHPLEEGHRAWANHLMGYMHTQGIV